LVAGGYAVVSIANLLLGLRMSIPTFLDNKNFKILGHDSAWSLYVAADGICDLQGLVSLGHNQFGPLPISKLSVPGRIKILALAKQLKMKILQASTSEVYGDPEVSLPLSYRGSLVP
jgi:UDP-glucuronate decarboxylase